MIQDFRQSCMPKLCHIKRTVFLPFVQLPNFLHNVPSILIYGKHFLGFLGIEYSQMVQHFLLLWQFLCGRQRLQQHSQFKIYCCLDQSRKQLPHPLKSKLIEINIFYSKYFDNQSILTNSAENQKNAFPPSWQ